MRAPWGGDGWAAPHSTHLYQHWARDTGGSWLSPGKLARACRKAASSQSQLEVLSVLISLRSCPSFRLCRLCLSR